MSKKPVGALVFWLFFFGWLFLAALGKAHADCILDTRIHIVEANKVDSICRDLYRVSGATVPAQLQRFGWCAHGSGILVVSDDLTPSEIYPALHRLIKDQCPGHAFWMRMKILDQQPSVIPKKKRRRRKGTKPYLKIEVRQY